MDSRAAKIRASPGHKGKEDTLSWQIGLIHPAKPVLVIDTPIKLESMADSKRKKRAKGNWIKLAEKNRILVDVKYKNPRVTFDGIGMDVGVKDWSIDSNNNKIPNMNKTKVAKRLKKKRRRLPRSISRKYNLN